MKQSNSYGGEYTASLGSIIRGSFVKYDRLSEITSATFTGTAIGEATELNIYIDLYSVLHQVFSRSFRTNIDNPLSVTSMLVNLCAHYRKFFRSINVKTKFFLVFSSNLYDMNRKLVFGYNDTFQEKYGVKVFRQIAENNFNILEVICPYLPDIHFIRSKEGFEVGVIMAHLIETYGSNIPNLIISKDLYPLQLCTKYPFTSYLFPIKKYDRESGIMYDDSIMIPLYEKGELHKISFWNLLAIRRQIRPIPLYDIDTRNYVMLEALHVFKERDMQPCAGSITECTKILKNLGGTTMIVTPDSLKYDDRYQGLPLSIIESRYNALNVDYMLPYYRLSGEAANISIQNLDDNGIINNINAKYFVNDPIDTLSL